MKKIAFFLLLFTLHAHAGDEKREAFEFKGLNNIFQILKGIFKINSGLDDGIVMSPAKDLCSCIFVVGQSAEYCLANHEQYQKFRKIGFLDGWIRKARVDVRNKTVTTENSNHLAVATYKNERLGCSVTRFLAKSSGKELIPQRVTQKATDLKTLEDEFIGGR